MIHKILLIDDLKVIYSTVNAILSPRGCEITYCSTGLEGIKKAEEQIFDLILLDIHLPDANGLEVCQQLKKLPAYQFRPILMLTSDMRKLERGLMVGASDYIIKPFKEVELIARVFTQLNVSKNQISSDKEVKGLRENLNNQHSKLEELQNDLYQYFYQTAHKLRSPLSSMEGLFSLMKIENPEVANNQYVGLIEQTVGKLTYINQQIAKIGEIKTHHVNSKALNLKSYIHSLVDRKFHEANMLVDIDSEIKLSTDSIILTNGIQPILENAVFYTGCINTRDAQISIKSTKSENGLSIVIEDNGPGISKDKLQKIFDMFYIGNDQSTGNGLGLFISKTALAKLNIDLKISSKENEYTKAILTIPNSIIANNQTHISSQKTA
ncbi:ATP-binding response regulator [Fulvivirga lutimaris]|uniref:ATP-binding response regulator n=1 Tax=Fulvivirga lutimaris TaxID=1819566 RepID=UPI0012BCD85C|nr:hybrid sensor histidine kinase/response regulator [Fulvivirga lutimaris]MTI39887.1 hybrid sensor histidine kinase/response regulator [Fulvivirga lutimaris]